MKDFYKSWQTTNGKGGAVFISLQSTAIAAGDGQRFLETGVLQQIVRGVPKGAGSILL